MQTDIRAIGTSKGVIIPAILLKQYGMVGTLEIEQLEEGIMLKPSKKKQLRQGWAEDAKRIAALQDDHLLIPDVFADEEFLEWNETDD